jgi:hypothetical protein
MPKITLSPFATPTKEGSHFRLILHAKLEIPRCFLRQHSKNRRTVLSPRACLVYKFSGVSLFKPSHSPSYHSLPYPFATPTKEGSMSSPPPSLPQYKILLDRLAVKMKKQPHPSKVYGDSKLLLALQHFPGSKHLRTPSNIIQNNDRMI